MRTTLVIPDTTYKRTKEAARREGCTMSEFMTEALEMRLAGPARAVRSPKSRYQVKPVSMGKEAVDVSNREELYRTMEEDGA